MILPANVMLRDVFDVFDVADELCGILAPLEKHLGMDERRRLVDAARSVAEADGVAAGQSTLALIDTVDRKLLPEVLTAASPQNGIAGLTPPGRSPHSRPVVASLPRNTVHRHYPWGVAGFIKV